MVRNSADPAIGQPLQQRLAVSEVISEASYRFDRRTTKRHRCPRMRLNNLKPPGTAEQVKSTGEGHADADVPGRESGPGLFTQDLVVRSLRAGRTPQAARAETECWSR